MEGSIWNASRSCRRVHRTSDVSLLVSPDPADQAEIYSQVGLRLTYQPGQRIVRAEAHLDQTPHWDFDSVRGGT